jgi:hypothetical protein
MPENLIVAQMGITLSALCDIQRLITLFTESCTWMAFESDAFSPDFLNELFVVRNFLRSKMFQLCTT